MSDESDVKPIVTSEESESEGSLAEFIVHDSDEEGDDVDDTFVCSTNVDSDDETRPSVCEEEVCEEDGEVETKDEDEVVAMQYTEDMEVEGSVVNELGVRRSMRSNKGKVPTRYVDEEYCNLMMDDVSESDLADEEDNESEEEFEC